MPKPIQEQDGNRDWAVETSRPMRGRDSLDFFRCRSIPCGQQSPDSDCQQSFSAHALLGRGLARVLN